MNSQALVTGNGGEATNGGHAVKAAARERDGRVDEAAPMLLVRVVKWSLLLCCWGLFVWWISLFYRMPSTEGKAFKKQVSTAVANTFWGKYTTNYLLYVVPVIGLALIALIYFELEERFPERPKCPASGKQPVVVNLWRSMWTQPLLVKTPVGVVTLMDIVIFSLVAVCTLWIWFELQATAFHKIDHGKPKKGAPSKTIQKWDRVAAVTGRALPFATGCLFIPVSRGSPLLRIIDVPFEQAMKYHRWMGYLTVIVVAVHGAAYAIAVGMEDKVHLLFAWDYSGISNLAGTISGVAGIVMAFASMSYVRARHFNFFFSMHHLYIIFFVFYVFHVDWNHAGPSMGPIILFFIDRFLRMVQSRGTVSDVTARVLPSGLVELRIPRQSGVKYNALGFLYVNIPGISRLQWHPFSTTSTPLDDGNALTVCIKPLGDWTQILHDDIVAQTAKTPGCPFAVKNVHAEGPYGHESNYFLRYKNLVMVAGGAGATPFLSIIHDLLKRYQLHQSGLPTNVHLIWCVRRSAELATLKTIKPSQIFPEFSYKGKGNTLNLNIHAYVTGSDNAGDILPTETQMVDVSSARKPYFPDSPQKGDYQSASKGMSPLNSFHNLWMIALILVSCTGFVLMHALFYHYVSSPKLQKKGEKFPTAGETMLHLISLFVGIVICGGSVIFFWIASMRNEKRGANSLQEMNMGQMGDLEGNGAHDDLFDSCVVSQGVRPQFKEFFAEVAEKNEGEEVGVMVCGPESLQESVAAACRARNFASLMKTPFHYHSVSFDL